ncbi:MAG: isoleucine--tRNA ligase [Nanoarchaeota archaeon]
MYDFKDIEKEQREYWRRLNLLKKLEERNKHGKPYFLLDGPPYANAPPHAGHLRTSVYKDVPIRVAFMKGMNVLFQPGFDTHGLPIENKVEKELKISSKRDIEKFGISNFTKRCKELAATNEEHFMKFYDDVNSWYSWKTPYHTFDNSYVEAGWWTFKKLWKQKQVYEGEKPVFWCPRCETSLAGYEVTDSYKTLSDPAVYIKFKVKNKDESLLVYTTTPWTLISNVALAVHPDESYIKVETVQGVLILAKERIEILEKFEMGYKILEEFKGKKLEGTRYDPIIEVPQQDELHKNKKCHMVYLSIPILKERAASKVAAKKGISEMKDIFEDFVTVQEGTGIVHTSCGHGKTDNEVGKHYGLPEPSPLDNGGKFTEKAGQYSGRFVKDTDMDIIEALKKTNMLLHYERVEHSYPVCWRCKSPLIFRMSKQLFLKVNRELMLKENNKVRWEPKYAKERMDAWISNAEDWNISRQRYWGIPIPIWKCTCGNLQVIGSVEELKELSKDPITEDFDLHDASYIKIQCNKCLEWMERTKDIFDVWYDSSIAPWAAFGYPKTNKEIFEEHYPVSRVNEGQDQIRGWFYYLLCCGTNTFGKKPYDYVGMPGWVVDKKGEKMSKSLGNGIEAQEAVDEVGGDAVRLYIMWDAAPYDIIKFNIDTIKKEIWKIFNVFLNLKMLLLSQKRINKKKLVLEDAWLLSKLNSMTKEYKQGLEDFEYHISGRAIGNFILNTLSREYIQIVRNRLDKNDETVAWVLKEALVKISILLAPISPGISEKVYREITRKESVHLEPWPETNEGVIDNELEEQFEVAQTVITRILAERETVKLGIRWPLAKVTVNTQDSKIRAAVIKTKEIILRAVNIKNIEITEQKMEDKLSIRLDTELSDELICEGYAREVIRRIQDLRKKTKLKKDDRIKLYIYGEYDLEDWKEEIKERVGATEINFEQYETKYKSREKIKDYEFTIGIELIA